MIYNRCTMTDEEKQLHNEEEQVEEATKDTETESVEEEVAPEETEEERIVRERAEYLDGWQRSQAEIKNLQKRHDEERKMFTTLGKESLLQDLIPMLDNFDAAMSNKEVWESVDANWRMGIEYIHQQFVATLENNGVVQFGAVGDVFDTGLHDPVSSEGEGDTVIEVLQKGYKIGDRVVRPAKVKLGD